jgi:succinate dehydrogenase / fumarate reductase cytochrome b subunit
MLLAMGRLRRLVSTSIGAKTIMALTGLGLFLFVIAHLLGNLTLLRGRDAMNDYAALLESMPALIWPARAGLLAIFVIHVTFAARLAHENRQARPEGYRHEDTLQATWASRHMLLTGAVIGAFVVYHLLHFTFHVVPTGEVEMLEGRRDVYGMVVGAFRNGGIVATYVVAQFLLGVHLIHGSKSLFQTMGWDHAVLRPLVHRVAPALAILVAAGNIFLPLSVLFGWVS